MIAGVGTLKLCHWVPEARQVRDWVLAILQDLGIPATILRLSRRDGLGVDTCDFDLHSEL
jgi:hypothetical protein